MKKMLACAPNTLCKLVTTVRKITEPMTGCSGRFFRYFDANLCCSARNKTNLESLSKFTLTNSSELVAFIMAGYLLVTLAYVLLRNARLLRSPLIRVLVITALVAGVAATAFGTLRHRYHGDADVMPWLEHMTIQFAGAFSFAMIMRYFTKRLRPHLSNHPTLFSTITAAPYIILGGWALGTLLLMVVPAPASDLGTDLTSYGFTYRLLVQLPILFYALLSCGLWLSILQNFGPARTPYQWTLKTRLLPISLAIFSWALLYANHLLWPLAALYWPTVVAPQNLNARIETLVPPLLFLNVGAWLWAILRPYSPANLLVRQRRFQRYRALSEAVSFVADGPLDRTWRMKYHLDRTERLLELTCERLGLSPATGHNAQKTFILSALAVDPPTIPAPASISYQPIRLGRPQLDELATLHKEFLAEPDFSPRKTYALDHSYPKLLPRALFLTANSRPLILSSYPEDLQLAAILAADAGLLPESNTMLDSSHCRVSKPLLLAYLGAKARLSHTVTP